MSIPLQHLPTPNKLRTRRLHTVDRPCKVFTQNPLQLAERRCALLACRNCCTAGRDWILVDTLQHPDDLACLIADGTCDDRARAEAARLVERRIEAIIQMRVRDEDRLTRRGTVSRQAFAFWHADVLRALRHDEFQLVRLVVHEEKRCTRAVQHAARLLDDGLRGFGHVGRGCGNGVDCDEVPIEDAHRTLGVEVR
jgi:hypothetical protein